MTSGSRRRLLRTTCASIATAGLLLTGAVASPVTAVAADLSPYDAVNMWIGTAKDPSQSKANDAYGNTFPGATLPFGMVQLSPTTAATGNTEGRNATGNWGGYMTSDTDMFIKGFGMTRLSGTGCNDRLSGFDLPFLPYTGSLGTGGTLPSSPGTNGAEMYKYYNQFTHADEEGAPGYYKVTVDADGVVQSANNGAKNTTVELTATTRTGISKIDFPSSGNAAVLFNVSGANNNNGASRVNIDVANRTISGYATAKTVCNEGSYRIFFSTTFDQPFTAVSKWQDGSVSTLAGANPVVDSAVAATNSSRSQGADKTGVVLQFATNADVEIRTGMSYVSAENAELNRTTEAPSSKTFANLQAEAKTTWENALGTIDVTGGTDKERTKFYTGLYHSLGHPNVYEDVNGQYRGYYAGSRDGRDWPTSGAEIKTLSADQEHEYVTYSSWDSLRGQMQLLALLFPKVGSDMAASIANMGAQVGTWYNWPHLGSAQKKMEGDGMQVIVASLYAFGSDDFDAAAAVDSMVDATSLGKSSYFRSNFRQYAGVGFIEDRWVPATSTTMDYAMADFAIAQLAKRVDKDAVYDQYMTRSHSWRNLVNQSPGANQDRIVPRDRKGHWNSFDLNRRANGNGGAPDTAVSTGDQYDQSTGNQYQWYMTQNMAGVIDALGGKGDAESYLDSLFNYPTLDRLDVSGSNSTGMYMSNQPSMHTPWVYSWLGKPGKATDVLDKARATMYYSEAIDTSVPSPANPGFANSIAVGLPGNDDLGSLSSWYVWSSIGLYPAIFGRAELLVTSPAYDAVTITSKNLDGSAAGRSIEITAEDQATNRYIQSSTVNGTASTKSYLPESFTQEGGTLNLTMGATPSAWGTGDDDVPPSFDDHRNGFNAVGTAEVGTVNGGSLDVGGVTLPRSTLASNGASPGATLTYDGVDYVWPDSAPLQPDHWIPNGQEVSINKKISKVGFLGVATNGPSSGTATVVYADGSTVTAPLTFPDWTNSEARPNARFTGTGRLGANGTFDTSIWGIYTSQLTDIDPSKKVAKVVLPTDVSDGLMHMFAVGTDAASIPQYDVSVGQSDVVGGQPVAVTGSGLTSGDQVTISIDTTPATTTTITVGASGTFNSSVALGAVAAGTYDVTVTVTSPGEDPISFLAGSITLSYNPDLDGGDRVERGTNYAFTGTGFAPGEAVAVTLASKSVSVTAQANGSIAGTIGAPETIGAYAVTAVGAVSQVEAERFVAVVYETDPNNPDPVAVTPSITLSASAASVQYGTAVTFTAAVSSGATGQVVFLSGDELVGSATLAGGKASVTTTLDARRHSVTAIYLGSPTHLATQSTVATVSVSKVKAKKVTVKGKKYKRGKATKVTVKVGKLTNGQRAAGTVVVRVGKKKARTVTIGAKKKKVTVKIAKKYTKKKQIKVRANFRPNDQANMNNTKSKVNTIKARK